MSPAFKNPLEFWEKNSEILQGISTENIFRSAFKYPDEYIKDASGNITKELMFPKIIQYMAKISPSWLKGFLDLDNEWTNSQEPNMINLRLQYAKYKKPFVGRRLYLVKLRVGEIEYELPKLGSDNKPIMRVKVDQNNVPLTDTTGQQILEIETVKNKKIGVLKPIKGGSNMLEAQVCVWHNPELGWNPEMAVRPKIKYTDPNTGLEVVAEANPTEEWHEEYIYKKTNFFVREEAMAEKIEQFGKDILAKDPSMPQEFFVFALGSAVEFKEWTNPKTKRVEKQPNIYLDDII